MTKRYSFILAPLLILPLALSAQTWDGDTNNNWTTDTNWVGDLAPANDGTAILIFDDGFTTNFTPNIDTPYDINTARFSGSTEFVLSGGPLTFSGIDAELEYTPDANAGTMSVNVPLVLNGTTLFTRIKNASGVRLSLAGDISGTGGIQKHFNNSTLRLAGDNTFSGGVQFSRGRLELSSDTALGTGTLDMSSGAANSNLINTKGGTLTLANDITYGTSADIDVASAFDGNITLGGTFQLTVSSASDMDRGLRVSSGGTLTLNGNITEDSNKAHDFRLAAHTSNDGTIVVNGDGFYTGQTLIGLDGDTVVGQVFINGDHSASSDTQVYDGTTLSGLGTVSQATINTNATVDPGDENGNNGQLTVAGNMTLADSSTVIMDLDASGTSDSILLTNDGQLSIGASTILSLTSSEALTGEYGIFSFSENLGDYGTFATILLNGSAQDWLDSGYAIDYGTTGISLTAVPEPHHYALMFGGMVALLCVWRRSRLSPSFGIEKHN